MNRFRYLAARLAGMVDDVQKELEEALRPDREEYRDHLHAICASAFDPHS